MTDVCANRHGGNAESVAAGRSIDKAVLLNAVVRHINAQGDQGATCWEVEQATGLSHQTASARCTEAKAKNLIADSGRRRPTRSGRTAAVYVATPVQGELFGSGAA